MRTRSAPLFKKYMIMFVGVLLITNFMASTIALFLFEKIPLDTVITSGQLPIEFAARVGVISIVIGTVFIFLATRIVIKPITKLSQAAQAVTKGDFRVQVVLESRRHDEISELTHNFNLMVNELAKNEYLHKDFVSNVSHEFKTPLSSIQGYAELLMMPQLSETKRLEYATVITHQTKRLAKLSTELLRLSELENEHLLTRKETFSLDEQIRDAILLLQNEWEQKNLDFDIQLESIHITGDKALLYQVWVNLIGNAIRYTQEHGQIEIKLTRSNGKLKIVICDNGIGISEVEQARIFERFYRGDESRSSGGTGLGLPIVKRIIELHEGKINVQSQFGKGTTFEVQI